MQLVMGISFSALGIYLCTWQQSWIAAGVLCLIWGNNYIEYWYTKKGL